MMDMFCRYRLLAACLSLSLLLSGCAAEKSLVVLLPEDGRVSGEVTVLTANGSQVLNQSWQAMEISAGEVQPANPVLMDEATVKSTFGKVLAAMPRPPIHYLLFFQLDSAVLTPESGLILPEILKTINERSPAELSVVGHTDTVDSVDYNYELGLLRAKTVADQLISLGAAPYNIEISSRGKSDLLVPTGDETLEPRNRRAEVIVR